MVLLDASSTVSANSLKRLDEVPRVETKLVGRSAHGKPRCLRHQRHWLCRLITGRDLWRHGQVQVLGVPDREGAQFRLLQPSNGAAQLSYGGPQRLRRGVQGALGRAS